MKIIVPSLGESVTEATVAKWLKKEGEPVEKDDVLVELETDKATLEVFAQTNGILTKIYFQDGQDVQIGEELAELEEKTNINTDKKSKQKSSDDTNINEKENKNNNEFFDLTNKKDTNDKRVISPSEAIRSGAGQKITSDDLKAFLKQQNLSPSERRKLSEDNADKFDTSNELSSKSNYIEKSERVQMSRLQRTMAKRLKSAQNTSAMLTTFNEVDMTEVIHIRKLHKEAFEKKYHIKLGFMSFFVMQYQ